MHKLFLTLALLFVCLCGYGQTNSGNMMIGGTISNRSQVNENNNDYRASSFVFSPDFGYFVSDNLAVGGNINLQSGYTEFVQNRNRYSSFGIGPFIRYYKFTSNEKFAFFGDASIALGGGRSENGTNEDDRTRFFRVALSPGVTYFFTTHWALDLSLSGISYQSSKSDNDNDDISTFDFGFSSMAPELGLRYHFGNELN